ncbi:hypothetical protein AYO40_03415 [Planctomycetaceae bacterium SCGC AG-212-D15]|nr:hypothetical protein AYO40_03415 [Planctomycetaceae bacterium SCGC AG-212-D15]
MLLIAAVAAWYFRPLRIEDRVARITPLMTKPELIELLGREPDQSSDVHSWEFGAGFHTIERTYVWHFEERGQTLAVTVHLGTGRRVSIGLIKKTGLRSYTRAIQ